MCVEYGHRAEPVGAFVVIQQRPISSGQLSSVAVLDARTGRPLRTVPVCDDANALAIDEWTGHIFITNNDDDTMNVLDAANGRILRPAGPVGYNLNTGYYPTGYYPLAVAVDARLGHVFTANVSNNSVSMLDAPTGGLLRVVPVAPGPSHLAVNARSGRVFVINSNEELWLGHSVPTPTNPAPWGWVPRPIRRLVTALLPRPTATPNPVSTFGTVSILDTTR